MPAAYFSRYIVWPEDPLRGLIICSLQLYYCQNIKISEDSELILSGRQSSEFPLKITSHISEILSVFDQLIVYRRAIAMVLISEFLIGLKIQLKLIRVSR